MSSHSIQSILIHWRWILSETVACASCWSALPSATAQQSESSSLMAFLSVSTIPVESTRTNIRARIDRQPLSEIDRDPILIPHHKPTDTEAWEKFELEFRPEQPSPSPVKHEIEIAKFGLDTAVFAVDRFVKSIANQADFSLDQGSLRHTRATSLGRSRENPRVKLDLNMWQGGRPYAGVQIIIPFGN